MNILFCGNNGANWITHVCIGMAIRSGHPGVLVVVNTAGLHLLCVGDKVGRFAQIPLLVSPVRASCTNSSLDLIDYQVDAKFLRDILESLSKLSR